MADVETRTKRYAEARGALADQVAALNAEIEQLKRAALPRLKELVARAAGRENELRSLIEASPALFEKPRTQMFHGIKVGFRKGSGGIDWEDDEQVVKLIRKHFEKEAADVLIKTTERPMAKALAELDVATLRKIGCTVEATGDEVVIKPADSEVEKIVNALLEDATETTA